ncbi:MAG: sensor histidine kinase [Nakamurella sp.]
MTATGQMSFQGARQSAAPVVNSRITPPHRGYRHEALFYRGATDFVAAVVPFIREGLDRGQPVMVAARDIRIRAIRDELGEEADRVTFVDMAVLGANPARIIPAWRDFIKEHSPNGEPIRGVGEPIWTGRRRVEIDESQFHEALLNLAITPDTPLWLLCPYDVDALDGDLLTEAHRSHPAIVDEGKYRGSTSYAGAYHVGDLFSRELAGPTGPVRNLVVSGHDGHQVADWVRRWAEGSGLAAPRSVRLATAIRGIAQASTGHSGRSEVLQMWQDGSALICQLHDSAQVHDPLIGRRPDGQENSRGLALRAANQTCDLVQVRSGPQGTTVRVHSWL